MELLIRRYGTIIDVTADGHGPTPPEIVMALQPHLTYTYKKRREPEDRYSPCGTPLSVMPEERQMFSVENGKLTTGFGLLWRVQQVLEGIGCRVYYQDITPPRPRPRCYEPDWDTCLRYAGEFRAKQLECLQAIAQSQCGLIHAVPGFGKTFLIRAAVLLYPHARHHVVCKVGEVARKIARELTEVVPNVGYVAGGKNRPGERVTVFTADSIHKSDGEADFLWGDEGHLLVAPRVSYYLGGTYGFSRNFTFTATPVGRFDGADAKLELFFGPRIFHLGYHEAVSLNLISPIRVRWLDIDLPFNPAGGRTGVSRLRWGVWRNDARNQIIANDIRQSYAADHQILCMCPTLEHGVHLWQKLPEFWLVYAKLEEEELAAYQKSRLLPPNFVRMTDEHRDYLRKGFESGEIRKVIATDTWSTGVSFDRLQTLYRPDARASAILDEQIPGRVGRIYEGKAWGEIVDCRDRFDMSLDKRAVTRRGHYDAIGYTQGPWPGNRLGGAL